MSFLHVLHESPHSYSGEGRVVYAHSYFFKPGLSPQVNGMSGSIKIVSDAGARVSSF